MSYISPPPSYDELYDSPHASTSSAPSTSLFGSLKQSLTSFTMAPSKLDLEVLPFDSVDMYGKPDKDVAYSLSGQILVKLVPPTSWFCFDVSQTEESFLLESLVVTFEGQSELVTPQTGHAACRLIEFSKELITDKPIVIRHSWSEGTARHPAQWYVTFNLNIPGWLPATCITPFGDSTHEEPEISYRLSAVAKYREDKPSTQSAASSPPPSSWRTTCYGYMKFPTVQTAKADGVNVTINRYFMPPPQCTLASSELPEAPFRSVEYLGTMKEGASATIPTEVLSKLRMRATVPERIPMDAESFPLLVKIRPDGLSLEERKRLQTPNFVVSVLQNEIVRSSMSTHYAQEWPVPAPADQPPNRPIPTRRLDAREYECGLIFNPSPSTSAVRSNSLLPAGFAGKFDLSSSSSSSPSSPSGAHFADARFDADDTWLRVRVDIPFRSVLVDPRRLPQYEDHPLPTLRPSARGPLLTVGHSLEIALACTYDSPSGSGSGRVVDDLKFTIPLTFVRVQHGACAVEVDASSPASTATVPSSTGEVRALVERMRSQPYALPAYNTLYHKNGVRREDPTPLPVYTKDPEATLSADGGAEVAGEQCVEGDGEHPAMTICKQTPLHKVAVGLAPS